MSKKMRSDSQLLHTTLRSLTTLRFIKYLKNKSKTWTSLSKMCKQCVTANTMKFCLLTCIYKKCRAW